MAAFLGISLWFALVTVLPGLVTLGVLWGATMVVVGPPVEVLPTTGLWDSTLALAVAVGAMVLTQGLGILLEEKVLIRRRWLGRGPWRKGLHPGIDPLGETELAIDPYDEYGGMYLLLAEMHEGEDTRGHLERAASQFFMTVNTLVSFAAGIVLTVGLASAERTPRAAIGGGLYCALLVLVILVMWQVAISRFELLGWSLWATRRRRIRDERAAPASA